MSNRDHSSSPRPPHLKHPQLTALERGSFSVTSGTLLASVRVCSEGCGREPPCLPRRRRLDVLPLCGLKGARVSGPRQGFEQVVEEARAQGFVHPVAGEEHVVHLVHALNVARAVFLLGFQA